MEMLNHTDVDIRCRYQSGPDFLSEVGTFSGEAVGDEQQFGADGLTEHTNT